MLKRVAVVGAGPSGLATVKELLDEGHAPTCFERADSAGGVFRFGESDGVVWESCRLTSSGLLTAFSDFPVPADRTGHMRVREYVEYLARYCNAFDLNRHIRYGTEVEAVTREGDGGWTVRTRDARGTREERYDAVALCSGLHQHPHLPRFPGQESFTGTLMHGAQYRRPSQVAGKRVLIVGAGESGADVAAKPPRMRGGRAHRCAGVSRPVTHDFRQAPGPVTSRLLNGAAHWFSRHAILRTIASG